MADDIVERLEKSSGPNRELDAEIACLLYAVPLTGENPANLVANRFGYEHAPPRYTSSLDAAMTLVPEGFASAVGTMAFRDTNKKPWACYWTPQGEPHSTEAETPALALTIAALKAREEMK